LAEQSTSSDADTSSTPSKRQIRDQQQILRAITDLKVEVGVMMAR
jgi:hypothetical protein